MTKDDIQLNAKNEKKKKKKKLRDYDTNNENMQPGFGMEFGIFKKWARLVMKRGERQTEGIALSNPEIIRTFAEKTNLPGMLEAGTINQVEMKERKQKVFFKERENSQKLSSAKETSSK